MAKVNDILQNVRIMAGTPYPLAFPAADAAGALTSDGSGALSFAVAANQMELLKANTGSNNTTSDNNFDTLAISGLGTKDCLQVYWMLTVTTANLIDPRLWNNTDSAQCGGLTENNITAGTSSSGLSVLRIDGTNTTTIGCIPNGSNAIGPAYSVSTAWTADWTLAMRGQNGSSGVTKWAWSVYKIRGTV